jgi:hypothetical protein
MKRIGPAILLCFLAAGRLAAALYVDGNSTNSTPPYGDWSTAASNIQDAVDAGSAGDLVLVTNGIYQTGGRSLGGTFGLPTNRVMVTKPITIRSVNGPAVTLIAGFQVPGTTNGDNAVRCVYLTNGAALIGFTLTNGATTSQPLSIPSMAAGGAVFYDIPSRGFDINVTVSSCILVNNSAALEGGGAYGCVLNACTLIGNSAKYGGGAASCELTNCVVSGNAAFDGGGLCNSTFANCTIVSNTAAIWGGAAAFSQLSPSMWGAMNSIILFNTPSNSLSQFFTNYPIIVYPPRYDYCCTTPLPALGTGNITNDPVFVSLAGADYHLRPDSPCINSGTSFCVAGSSDLDGNPRTVGGTVDIGAYEFQSPSSVISYAWLQRYGLPTDGSADFADPDGDGLNNWQEWRAGTDPTNALSVLKVLSLINAGSGITVRWQSVGGVTYYLQRGTNLAVQPAFPWVRSNILGVTGVTSYNDTGAAGPGPFFYRVGVQ